MRYIFLILYIASSTAVAQHSNKSQLTLFYFGGTDCYYCNLPENVKNINKIHAEFPRQYKNNHIKFVMVVMDKEIPDGLKYLKKYGYWDEISVGGFYNNELMLEHVNRSRVSGVPQIMVYQDSLSIDTLGVPVISKRTQLIDLLGKNAINQWVSDHYPLEKAGGL